VVREFPEMRDVSAQAHDTMRVHDRSTQSSPIPARKVGMQVVRDPAAKSLRSSRG